MTRLQEAPEWAGWLNGNSFLYAYRVHGSVLDKTLGKKKWQDWPWKLWANLPLDTRLLALAFAATAPAEFR